MTSEEQEMRRLIAMAIVSSGEGEAEAQTQFETIEAEYEVIDRVWQVTPSASDDPATPFMLAMSRVRTGEVDAVVVDYATRLESLTEREQQAMTTAERIVGHGAVLFVKLGPGS